MLTEQNPEAHAHPQHAQPQSEPPEPDATSCTSSENLTIFCRTLLRQNTEPSWIVAYRLAGKLKFVDQPVCLRYGKQLACSEWLWQ